jgi:cytochrome c
LGYPVTAGEERGLGIGREVSEAAIANWDIDVSPDGSGLPSGRGTVEEGERLYQARCTSCHGLEGRGGPMEPLAGGRGSLKSNSPRKTVGSYWPYATTVFDYVRRAMPIDNPQSLSADETYALTAYLLALNDIIEPNEVMDALSLPKVEMPNRAAFRPDPRPDVQNVRCLQHCGGD